MAMGAHSDGGNESYAHCNNVLEDLVACEVDTYLLTRSTFTLELQLFCVAA